MQVHPYKTDPMDWKHRWHVWLFIAALSVLTGCASGKNSSQVLLHIEGVSWAFNLTTSYILFGSIQEAEDIPEVYLTVSPGDLLYLMDEEENEIYYRYSKGDGNTLHFSYDSLKPDLYFEDGDPVQLEISGEIPDNSIVSSGNRSRSLSTLILRGNLTDNQLEVLKKNEPYLQGVGLVIEELPGEEQLLELMDICQPSWMMIESLPSKPASISYNFLEDLELLWITGDLFSFVSYARCCRNLRTLIISEWEPAEGEILDLTELKKLNTLSLAECDLHSLSAIEQPRRLERLFLNSCDLLEDISTLPSFTSLHSIGLAGCGNLRALEPLMETGGLTHLLLPDHITQSQLETVTEHNRNLSQIEILGCEGITDLAPLSTLEDLEVLSLQTETPLPENLESLDQLVLLILEGSFWDENPSDLEFLRGELPRTRLVPGSGLCVGSGWLLLLLPMILLARWKFRRN